MGGVGLEQLSDLCLAHSSSPNKQSIHTLSVVLADNSPTLLLAWGKYSQNFTILLFLMDLPIIPKTATIYSQCDHLNTENTTVLELS